MQGEGAVMRVTCQHMNATCHMLHVTYHMLHVTCSMLHATCHMSQIQAVRIAQAWRCCSALSHVTRLWQNLNVSLLQAGCGGGDTRVNITRAQGFACWRLRANHAFKHTPKVPCPPTPTPPLTHSLHVHNQRLLLRNQREFRFWIGARQDRRRLAVDNSHGTNGK